MFKRLFLFCACSILLTPSVASATNTIIVNDEVKNTAAFARDEAKAIAEQKRAIAEATDSVVRDEAELARVEEAQIETEQAAITANSAVKLAEEAAQKALLVAEEKNKIAEIAEAHEAAAKVEIMLANQALEKAKIAAERAADIEAAEVSAAEATAAVTSASAAAKAVEMAGDNEAKMDQAIAFAEAAADRAYAIASARAMAAEKRTNDAVTALEAAEQRVALAEEKMESAAELRAEAIDVTAAAADAQKDLEDAKVLESELIKEVEDGKVALQLAKTDLASSKIALDEAAKQRELVGKRRAIQLGMHFFSWKDNTGNSGYQFYQPYEFDYFNKNTQISLRTGYVISSNKGLANGKVSTLTDTVLSVMQQNTKDKYSMSYGFDMNLPTGKSGLNGTNAIMPDDLVELSRFGTGWSYTPRVSVSRKIGEEDTWTFETYYALNSSYTYDTSIVNGRISPGNEWGKTLRWLHAGQKWQFVGELTHASFSNTQEGDITLQEGSQLDTKLNYTRELSQDQSLTLYYWHSAAKPYTSSDPVAAGIDGLNTLNSNYYGAIWSKNLPKNRTFRVMTHIMRSSGDIYNTLTNLTVNGRSKYSLGVGYDIDLTVDKKLSFDLERFYMKDHYPATSYHGYNLYFKYMADM